MSKITYKSICDKLGFDVVKYMSEPYKPGLVYEDDSKPSIWSVLTLEEMYFLCDNGYLK